MPEITNAIIPARRGRPAVPVVVRQNPFDSRRVEIDLRDGLSIQEIVDGCEFPAELRPLVHAFVDDIEVPRSQWRNARPKAGTAVYVCVLPQGGGGDGKNPLAAILTLVVAVAAIAFAPVVGAALLGANAGIAIGATTLGTIVGGLVINLVGALVIGALIKPPQGNQFSNQPLSAPSYQITGSSNRRNPYGPIPRVFGKRRIYPVVAANPYTESEGNDQYLRLLLCAGYGPLRISDIRIGETPLSEFEGVETEITEGGPAGWAGNTTITLYTNTIREESYSIEVTKDLSWVSRFTQLDASEASFDITFPRGLSGYNDKGDRVNRTVSLQAQWRRAGTEDWTTLAQIDVTEQSSSAVRVTRRIKFPTAAQYEIRLRRLTDPGGTKQVDASYWTVLRSIIYKTAVLEPGLCLIAIRIRASEQLNGTPSQINCIAESYLPRWDPLNGFTWGITDNPAWAYLDILRRRGQEILIADSRIDLVGIRAWAGACNVIAPNANEPYWTFNGVIEGGSVFEALSQIAGNGRANFTIRDGKYSVVRDVAQTVPVQHITPRNSWGYQGRKTFIDLPHALKMRFVNEAKGYVEDERIVYDDGYTEATATKFETIELYGCTSATQAWREGRYHLAVGQLRPEEHTVMMDIEALRCTLGDLVRFSHDVVAIGAGSGRIMQRVYNEAGRVAQLRLDGPVQMEAGRLYGLRVRRMDGSSVVVSVNRQVGLSDILTLTAPMLSADAPDEDDLFMFGEASRESSPMLIKKIEPGTDLTAKVTMVSAASGVWTADTRAIPDFNSNITIQGPLEQQGPSAPTFALRSDETALLRLPDGSLQDRIAVLLDPPGSSVVSVAGFEAQYKESASTGYIVAPRVTSDAREVFLSPAVQGIAYDVRVRAISEAGVPSAWTTTTGHVVVGKTTPPEAVADFSAARKVDGVQLAWTPNTEIDVVGYTIKQGNSWDTGTLVTEKFSGTSLFVGLATSAEQRFMIRAVDAIGLLSFGTAVVFSSVVAPSTVPKLDAYPQGDRVRLAWTEVEGVGNLYEIREGESWDLGRLVLRAAGSTTLVQWPTTASGDRTWWVRAISAAGLYSPNATFATTAQAPISDRNVVIDRDLSAEGFPGIVHDIIRDLTPGAERLELAKDGAINRASGVYFADVDLAREWYARNWIELRAVATTGSDLTWATSGFTWETAGEGTWLGLLSDSTGVEATPQIYLDAYPEPSLVEGWQLAGAATGLLGTTAADATGLNYGDGYFRQGALVDDFTTLDWDKNVPAQFSATFDVAASDATAGYSVILRLDGSNGWLQLGYDEPSGFLFLEDGSGNRLEVPVPAEDGDVITIGVDQSLTRRSLYAATRRYPSVVADVDLFAPVGTFTTVALHA